MFVDPDSAQIGAVAFSPDGKVLAVGDAAGTTYLWNVATGEQFASLSDPAPRASTRWPLAATGSYDTYGGLSSGIWPAT